MLENDCAAAILIKRKNGLTTEFLHDAAEIATSLLREQIAMKGLA